MATNPFFYEDSASCDQELLNDIIVEDIQIRGKNCFYIKKTFNSVDQILGEDALMSFEDSYPLEMYIETFDAFGGEGQFISKFGLESKNKITFVVSASRFAEILGSEYSRPLEGDLVWLPMIKNFFEIIYVDDNSPFYVLGKKFTFKLFCQTWAYSSEQINTSEEILDTFGKQQKEFAKTHDNEEFGSFGSDIINNKNIFGIQ